jgi:hypothetical protein
MAEMLLINPRRRKARRAAPARKRAPSRRRASRRRNPAPALAYSPVRRRRRLNPLRAHAARRHTRRRRNPIGGSASFSSRSIMGMLKEALIGGVGAVGMDLIQGQVNPMLPASLQTQPNTVGAGDAVKAALTVALGVLLKKPTRGLSVKMAQGALTTQVRDLIAVNLPTTMPIGFMSPARVIRGSQRVGPGVRQGIPNVSAYQGQGTRGPLLSAYQGPGMSPLLSNSKRVMDKEGILYR